MGEEEDGRPPRPSTSISLTQGYYGTVNPYNLPYMMPSNTYRHPYPYAWGSQHSAMPPCVPNMPYPHCASESSTMPSNVVGEKNLGETSSDINIEPDPEGMNEVSDDDNRVEPPKSGMQFSTDKEVLDYYKRYAKQEGFGVIIKRTKRDLDGDAKYVTIGCARGGRYYPSHSNLSKPRPTTKTDCKAKINTRFVNGVWVLISVDLVHNHSTVSSQKSRLQA
ncbi:protein FAR1-RELATED SEQUENCE 1-like [Juglans microcarpa x Juglans regia]|uniref:protein FAR1-RELATED SEQUENCE 1-like n=1 Tax=Juglans microcarpa x Juglans regia TaxID=2249226 RepID=UPI001B7F1DD3|nr:protein FAR1-RELATED SEQUENCE 1-like [Juglans microcarpa x Juglans regia]